MRPGWGAGTGCKQGTRTFPRAPSGAHRRGDGDPVVPPASGGLHAPATFPSALRAAGWESARGCRIRPQAAAARLCTLKRGTALVCRFECSGLSVPRPLVPPKSVNGNLALMNAQPNLMNGRAKSVNATLPLPFQWPAHPFQRLAHPYDDPSCPSDEQPYSSDDSAYPCGGPPASRRIPPFGKSRPARGLRSHARASRRAT